MGGFLNTQFISIPRAYCSKCLGFCFSKRLLILTVLFLSLSSFYIYANLFSVHHGTTIEISSNNLEAVGNNGNGEEKKFVLNTTNCKIPEFVPWSRSAELLQTKCTPYFRNKPNCEKNRIHSWTYMNGSFLHINMSAVRQSGYSQDSIRCCYREISRVEQNLTNYNMQADRVIKYSDKCFPITESKQFVEAEFIRVFCMSTSVPLINDVVSREFFAIAKTDERAIRKINRWKKRKESGEDEVPPTVIIFGVDTLSRLNAHRTLTETLNVLRSIGAIEIDGYTKVGETTFPNTVAFLAGYKLNELGQFCYQSTAEAQDFCPYLWKAYEKFGYLTATLDDAPFGTAFNFLKAGFVHKPTDFFIRPMMLAVMKHMPRPNNWYVRCIGRSMIEEVIIKYINDILASSQDAPVFIHSWLTVLAHECSIAAKHADTIFAKFLREVDKKNTIIVFMGDHGEVFGQFRETVQGWYEDKLPSLWIYLPDKLKARFPQWVESLHINSKRLTSHFDLYKTLVHILQTFDTENLGRETYEKQSHQYGQTLFQPVPENRSCSDAGVPEGYCACSEPQSLNVSDPQVLTAVNVALQYIIKMLPKECEIPELAEVVEAKFFVTPKDYNVYIVTFITNPGHFMFEGTVKQDEKGELVVANDVLRMNKIVRKALCITIPLLERYCYCK